MRRIGGAAVLAAALTLTGCGGNDSAAPPQAPDTTTSEAGYKLGDPITFQRKDNGQPIGTIKFLEVLALPDSCSHTPVPPGGQVIGVRAEISNPGEIFLPRPDIYGLRVVDHGGFTQQATASAPACQAQFPEISGSQPRGKTTGWAQIIVREPDPVALIYAPIVGEADSTLGNLKFVTASPTQVSISLSSPLPQPATATTTTTTPPPPAAPSTPPAPAAAPAAGMPCAPGADTWAKDTRGQQLRCAQAGGPAMWVESAPFIGTRTPGTPCQLGAAVAEAPDRTTLICVGDQGAATWQPGP